VIAHDVLYSSSSSHIGGGCGGGGALSFTGVGVGGESMVSQKSLRSVSELSFPAFRNLCSSSTICREVGHQYCKLSLCSQTTQTITD